MALLPIFVAPAAGQALGRLLAAPPRARGLMLHRLLQAAPSACAPLDDLPPQPLLPLARPEGPQTLFRAAGPRVLRRERASDRPGRAGHGTPTRQGALFPERELNRSREVRDLAARLRTLLRYGEVTA